MFVRKATKEQQILLHRVTLEKHATHDQSSHGRKGGKGGGGGSGVSVTPEQQRQLDEVNQISSEPGFQSEDGAGDPPKRNNQMISSTLQGQVSNAENKLSDFDEKTSSGSRKFEALSDEDQQTVRSASKNIAAGRSLAREAKSAKTDKAYRSKLGSANNKFDRAMDSLMGAENSRLQSAGLDISRAMDKFDALILPDSERDF